MSKITADSSSDDEQPRKGRRRRANGEGTIYQRKDGRWAGAVYVLTDTGHYKRQPVYGKSWEQVHDKITELKSKSQQGIPLEASTQLTYYMRSWLEEVCRPQLRARTFETYERCVDRHIVPMLGKKTLRRLTPMDVRRLLNERTKSGLSAQTVRYIHAVLRSALAQAHRDGLVQRNAASLVQPPRAKMHEVKPLTVAEARQLLQTALDTRLHALWVLALTLGLRRGELLGLTWSGLDLENGTIEVRQSVQRVGGELVIGEVKTARSRRRLPLPLVAVTALREHKRRQLRERLQAGEVWDDHGLIFCTEIGTPIDPRNLNRSFTKLLIRARVRVTEHPGKLGKNGDRGPSTWTTDLRLHDLRHTCASLLLALDVPMRVVMEILGHSQIGITSNLYTHVLPDVLKGSLDGMDGLFGS